MIDLLKNDFPAHYGLRRTKITVLSETTSEQTFDLDDKREKSSWNIKPEMFLLN